MRARGGDHDYVDLFVADVPHARERTAEQWARATMEGASAVGRFLAWQTLLALRLDHSPSPDRIAGWRIAHRGEGWIRVEASSWHTEASMVFSIEEERVLFATFLRYRKPPAALIWGGLSAVHRAAAPGFLRNGVRT